MSIKEIKAKLDILTVLSHYGLSPDHTTRHFSKEA